MEEHGGNLCVSCVYSVASSVCTVWLKNSIFGKTLALLVKVLCHQVGELYVCDKLFSMARMVFYNNFLWYRALDKLLFSFSSIPLDCLKHKTQWKCFPS